MPGTSEARQLRWWRMVLAAGLAALFVNATLLPLSDIDLPMHLAVGEWIMRHHTVPLVEPFAWTRAGAPYFAYSWLAEVSAYLLLAAMGPLGLHLLHGLAVASAAAAVVVLGRAAGWKPCTIFLIVLAHVAVLARTTPALRPQGMLYVVVPLAWAAAYWLARPEARAKGALAALFAASVVAANVHILFPLTMAPVLWLATRRGVPRRRVGFAAAAVVIGWLCSPYALHWPAVFALNFAPNPLFRFPTGIAEFQPGFVRSPVLGALLALLPWPALALRDGARGASAPGDAAGDRTIARSGAEPAMLLALWLVGLVGFALAEKTLTVWWLLVLPLAGAAAARVKAPSWRWMRPITMVPIAIAVLLIAVNLVTGAAVRREEGTVVTRTLPGPYSSAVEPIARWLVAHAHPARRVRLFTSFDYGSYLTWRLPGYSASIDSRTIFPDSVANAEAMAVRALAGKRLGPWPSADVAIVPRDYAVAAVLDTARTWRRVVVPAAPSSSVGLWVRRAWWDSVRVRRPAGS